MSAAAGGAAGAAGSGHNMEMTRAQVLEENNIPSWLGRARKISGGRHDGKYIAQSFLAKLGGTSEVYANRKVKRLVQEYRQTQGNDKALPSFDVICRGDKEIAVLDLADLIIIFDLCNIPGLGSKPPAAAEDVADIPLETDTERVESAKKAHKEIKRTITEYRKMEGNENAFPSYKEIQVLEGGQYTTEDLLDEADLALLLTLMVPGCTMKATKDPKSEKKTKSKKKQKMPALETTEAGPLTTEEKIQVAEQRVQAAEEAQRAAEEKQKTAEEKQKAAEEAQKKAEEAQKAAEEASMCLMCFDAPKNMLMFPCMHVFYCKMCFDIENIRHPEGHNCPLCRGRIATTLAIHM